MKYVITILIPVMIVSMSIITGILHFQGRHRSNENRMRISEFRDAERNICYLIYEDLVNGKMQVIDIENVSCKTKGEEIQ